MVKNPFANIGEKQVQSLGWKDPLEEGMATHSSILAWRLPWTEDPGRLQSMGSQSWIRLKQLGMHAHSLRFSWEKPSLTPYKTDHPAVCSSSIVHLCFGALVQLKF